MAGKTYDRRKNRSGAEPSRPQPRVRRRTIKRDEETTQLLERGEGPTAEGQLDPGERDIPAGAGDITDSDEGIGQERPEEPRRSPSAAADPPNTWGGGAGGRGGANTLSGESYPEVGSSSEDVLEHTGGRDRDLETRAQTGGRDRGLETRAQTGGGDRNMETRAQTGEEAAGMHRGRDERRMAERRSDRGATQGGRASARPSMERRRPSDESLAEEIRQLLLKDPEIEATDVVVEVEDGTVTLTGVVESPDAKLLAEELVESVIGVQEVQNLLEVAG